MINIEEFQKTEMKVGEVLSAERVPNSEKLLKLSVNLGEESPRQVVSGIAKFFSDPELLVGKKCMFVTNLEPRMLMGLESQAMILAVSTPEGQFSLITPDQSIPPGTSAK
jgi:methionine--tRNA ligase beta chain